MRVRTVIGCACVAGLGVMGASMAQQPSGGTEKPVVTLGEQVEGALAKLDWLVGEFEAKGTFGGPKPDGTRDEQKGTWKNERVLGGRHLRMTFDVEVASRRVEYWCVLSWNPREGVYETTWTGSSGYRFSETGTYDEGKRALTLVSHQPGADGELEEVTSVFRQGVNGEITVTDSKKGEDGKDVVTFYVELRRKK
ncbi:MAG: DUF1579 family protein [Phycisphaerales bacterium]